MRPLPRRVLMTTDAVGGVWDQSLELARGLIAAGVDVLLAVIGPEPDRDRRAAAALPGLSLHLMGGRLEWMDDPWAELDRAGARLVDLAARADVGLVHASGLGQGALPFTVPCLVVAHSCVPSWWQAVKGQPAPAGWDEYRRRARAGLAAASAVVTPSAAMRRDLVQQHGPLPHLQVIRNGRRPEDWAPPQATGRQRFVLAVGRLWDEGKNVGALGRVASRLPWPVKVAGETVEAGTAGGRTSALGGVIPLGRLDAPALRALYQSAAIYALPARYEPFGLSVLEAALGGCALVLGDIPSLRELWSEAALFVPPGDDRALERALRLLMADGPQRERLAAAARQRARRYTAARMVAGYLDLYRRLPGRTRRPAAGQGVACAW